MCQRTRWSADDCERSLLYPWTGWMRWGREEQIRYRIEASVKVASWCWLCWEVMTDDSENSERSCSGTASSPCPCMITARQTALRAARNHIRLRFRIILHAKLQFSADINTNRSLEKTPSICKHNDHQSIYWSGAEYHKNGLEYYATAHSSYYELWLLGICFVIRKLHHKLM